MAAMCSRAAESAGVKEGRARKDKGARFHDVMTYDWMI